MATVLLLLNGAMIAGLYALGRYVGIEGVSPLGLLYWQASFSAVAVGLIAAMRRELPRVSSRHLRYYAVAGLLGLTLPYLATYTALAHLPAGVVGIVGSLSALFTYVIARAVGAEQASCVRTVGIAIGLAGVLGILVPKGALPGSDMAGWVLLASAAPLALAGGNVYRTLAWPPGLSPLGAATGMLLVQVAGLGPVVALADAFVFPGTGSGRVDLALVALGLLSSATYAGSFVLQRQAGPVVVSQLGYVITVATLAIGVGVFGERYSAWVWLAVALVFVGVYFVNRRPALPACAA